MCEIVNLDQSRSPLKPSWSKMLLGGDKDFDATLVREELIKKFENLSNVLHEQTATSKAQDSDGA